MHQHRRENRKSKRTPKRQAASIVYGSNNIRLPCMIWDLSESGARLAAPRSKSLPNTFLLVFNREGTARRGCRVAWRSDAQVGVQFVSADEFENDSARYPIQSRSGAVAHRSSNQGSGAFERADAYVSLRSMGMNDAAGAISRRRSGSFFSSSAAVLLTTLASATILFHWAGPRSEQQAWAHRVCDAAANFCEHPEMMAVASVLMGIVLLAARGMAR